MEANLEKLLPLNLDRIFNEPDANRREEALRELWHEDGRLVDPQGVHQGYAQISKNVGALHRMFPDGRFEETSPVQEQSGVARMSWICRSASKGDLFTGMDVAEARDGRIASIFAFRDETEKT